MDKNLSAKLGLKPELKAYILHAPEGYSKLLPPTNEINDIKKLNNKCEWIQAFYYDNSVLGIEITLLKDRLSRTGQLWLSWPKKSSGVKSDLNDNTVRQLGLDAGLVDVKIASINSIWSGLKFVYRTSDR
jgi:hypothetical protein